MPPSAASDSSDSARSADAASDRAPGSVAQAPTWLILLPQLPASPSSLRVQVWRRTRAAGALGLQTGVIVLPHTPAHERFFQRLLAEIEREGGSGTIFVGAPLDQTLAATIIERFRADRDQEYAEFCERCEELLAELAKESRGEKFTFAELEENEHDLEKLRSWLGKIQARDHFGGHHAEAAQAALAACQRALQRFTHAVYAREGVDVDEGVADEAGGAANADEAASASDAAGGRDAGAAKQRTRERKHARREG